MKKPMRTILAMVLTFTVCFVAVPGAAWADDIEFMSLDSLMSIQVSAASKYDQTSLEAPASVTILTSDDIRRYGWRTLEDALITIRGFYLSDDLNGSFLGIRRVFRQRIWHKRISIITV